MRASKVLWKSEWPYDEQWGQLRVMERVDEHGVVAPHPVLQSVETVVQFAPRDDANARDIVTYLHEQVSGREAGALPDSNYDPDIRATLALAGALREIGFMIPAQANTLRAPDSMAQLVALRQATPFAPPWQAQPIEANKELVGYLADEGVRP